MQLMIIARGIPGSGKTTFCKNWSQNLIADGYSAVICSADDFFTCKTCNAYHFHPKKLKWAHEWCREEANEAMRSNVNAVFIDNTNTTAKECKPYVELAIQYGYRTVIWEAEFISIEESVIRNTHGVPRETIERMVARFEHNLTIERILCC